MTHVLIRLQYNSIGLNNSSAKTGDNDGPVYRRMYMAIAFNELNTIEYDPVCPVVHYIICQGGVRCGWNVSGTFVIFVLLNDEWI